MTRAVFRIALSLAGLLALAAAPAPVATTTTGRVLGTPSPNGKALIFRAIPFAAPPLGAMRWTAPQPVAGWTGIRQATQRGPACLQNDYKWNAYDHAHDSEDCLTLDVRTPSLTGKRPVLVWIHGGSNRAGSAGDTVLSNISDRGIVVVAVQYRLGIFGFLSPDAASGTGGNYGLMDQIAALDWVRKNIARFGGDPAQVTIAGESAGSQDVGLLLAAPAARPLFARAIMESGTPGFGMSFRSLGEAKALGAQVHRIMDTGGSMARLRATSADALLAADLKLHDAALSTDEFMWLKTTIDGSVLPAAPDVGLKRASAKPVLIGSNRAEFGPSAGSQRFPEALRPIFGAKADRAAALYRFADPAQVRDPRLGHPELEVATDWIFRCPAGRMADLLSQSGAPVWRYEFDLPAEGLSTHAGELRYVFDDIAIAPGVSMQDYWVNFIKTGSPNGTGLPHWPEYAQATRAHVTFDKRGVTEGANLRAEICDLLLNI